MHYSINQTTRSLAMELDVNNVSHKKYLEGIESCRLQVVFVSVAASKNRNNQFTENTRIEKFGGVSFAGHTTCLLQRIST